MERKRKTEPQFAGGRRRGKKKTREKKDEDREITATNHRVADMKGTHHNLCREKLSRNDCFPDLHLGLNENLRMREIHASFACSGIKLAAREFHSELLDKYLHFETK